MSDASRVDRLLGSPGVERLASTATASHLRVLAYHGVPDVVAFRRQLEHIAGSYRPVSGAEVAAAVHGGRPLPRGAVWITFDDGRADVVEQGLPELDRLGLVATLFVCPGLILEGRPFWWDVVTTGIAAAGSVEYDGRTWTDRSLVTALKRVPDPERRAVVESISDGAGEAPNDTTVLTLEQLVRWRDAGQEVGNHTWDHPCLDQCTPDEQRSQVDRAHDALTDMLGTPPDLFAYPNGDWADAAERSLIAHDYRIGLLFDHRLASVGGPPLRMSRLRIDADAPMRRTSAILSGAHSTLFTARAALGNRLGRGASRG